MFHIETMKGNPMPDIELLRKEKKILYKEIKTASLATRKDEIINRILEIEQELLRLSWERVSRDPKRLFFTT